MTKAQFDQNARRAGEVEVQRIAEPLGTSLPPVMEEMIREAAENSYRNAFMHCMDAVENQEDLSTVRRVIDNTSRHNWVYDENPIGEGDEWKVL